VKFWPFPLIRNYMTDEALSVLFEQFANDPSLEVMADSGYRLKLRGRLGVLEFWNANRWYAWASEGTFHPVGKADDHMIWHGVMPSRWAVRRMCKATLRVRKLQWVSSVPVVR
jgi:hypothetical protein